MKIMLISYPVRPEVSVRSHPPSISWSSSLRPDLFHLLSVHHSDSILWAGCSDGLVSFREGRRTCHLPGKMLSITSQGTALYTLRYSAAYYLTRWETLFYPTVFRLWEEKVEASLHLASAGEKLVLGHNDHLGVYSCDSGQQLSQITCPGVSRYSRLCGVKGRAVLARVKKRLMLVSLGNQQEQPILFYECEEEIHALCTDDTGDRVFIATNETKTIDVINLSGKTVWRARIG